MVMDIGFAAGIDAACGIRLLLVVELSMDTARNCAYPVKSLHSDYCQAVCLRKRQAGPCVS